MDFFIQESHFNTMSDIQAIMKFEFLPNEILIEYFEYLNAIDIFYSSDYLNSRFYNLIRNIPLHLNIEHVKKSALVQFCNKISLNPQMKKQIVSLKLSNKNRFDTIQTLFSFVSLDELSQLQSLTLLDLDEETVIRMLSMLPLLTNLCHFRMTESSSVTDEILTSLPSSTLQTLYIPKLPLYLTPTHSFASLVSLNISRCSVKNVCHFFKYSPQLQYLSIERVCEYAWLTIDELCLINDHAVHLKRLIIHSFEDEFDVLEILLERTPDLKVLIISTDYDRDIIDAYRWQKLITTSLPLLNVFKFKFSCVFENDDPNILDKFQQFQSDFWQQQHQWHTECTFNKSNALIYTIPYISNEYEITPYTKRYYNEAMNNLNTFTNVTDLTLCPEAMTNNGEYHFPNVKSLQLANSRLDENYAYTLLKRKHIQCLRMIVNLCHLTHLAISSEYRLRSSSMMLQLMKEAPHLSSLKINYYTLFPLFNNRRLCESFNKRIKKLDVTGSGVYTLLTFKEIMKLCHIVSNMEEFRCDVGKPEHLFFTLNQLSKLVYMKVFSYRTQYLETGNRRLKFYVSKLDLYSYTIECETEDYVDDFSDYDTDFD